MSPTGRPQRSPRRRSIRHVLVLAAHGWPGARQARPSVTALSGRGLAVIAVMVQRQTPAARERCLHGCTGVAAVTQGRLDAAVLVVVEVQIADGAVADVEVRDREPANARGAVSCRRGVPDGMPGSGLAGDAVPVMVAARAGDRVGRRRGSAAPCRSGRRVRSCWCRRRPGSAWRSGRDPNDSACRISCVPWWVP